jgi:hypothetical protein
MSGWTFQEMRYWLIQRLAGKSTIILNATIQGTVQFEKGAEGGLIAGCTFEKARNAINIEAPIAKMLEKERE